jgi:hypothetical protein
MTDVRLLAALNTGPLSGERGIDAGWQRATLRSLARLPFFDGACRINPNLVS